MRWLLRWLLLRLGSRTILWVGGILFLLNVVIPDPIPFLDEILILVGTTLLSRWTRRAEREMTPGAPAPGEPKHVGRGSTQR
jgi:hypothetical protein